MSRRPGAFGVIGALLGAGMLLLLGLPVVALFVTSGPAEWLAGLRAPITAPALLLSLGTTLASLAIVLVFGTPLAWWLARSDHRLARSVETAVQLPIVVPPAVAGLALLLTFGRRGLVGPLFIKAGLDLSFSTAAVVIAQTFVSAPFFIQAATASFAALDENLIVVARTLGASPARVFFRIAVPLARRGLITGAALAWARALGEFGATLMFAGNLSGRTQTLPLAVYTAFESDLRAAQALAVLLVVIAAAMLAALRPRRARLT